MLFFLFLLFLKRHKNEKKTMSKSQVRAGRLLLWQKNHFNILTGVIVMVIALVVVSRSFK